ncbi:hypothetical protein BGW80DRAFT_1564810 [Lactifluus volemus]|nr:hypothetical protein BGW80DRAFT_1564810 [Lactifluus volemus]
MKHDDFSLLNAYDQVVAVRKVVIRVSNQSRGAVMRDELRDGYHRLEHALPSSNQKSGRVSPGLCPQLRTRLQHAENETTRLRQINEALMLGTAKQRHAAAATQQQQQSIFGSPYRSLPCSPFLCMDSAALHSLFSALSLPIPSPPLSPPLAIHGRERPD